MYPCLIFVVNLRISPFHLVESLTLFFPFETFVVIHVEVSSNFYLTFTISAQLFVLADL